MVVFWLGPPGLSGALGIVHPVHAPALTNAAIRGCFHNVHLVITFRCSLAYNRGRVTFFLVHLSSKSLSKSVRIYKVSEQQFSENNIIPCLINIIKRFKTLISITVFHKNNAMKRECDVLMFMCVSSPRIHFVYRRTQTWQTRAIISSIYDAS